MAINQTNMTQLIADHLENAEGLQDIVSFINEGSGGFFVLAIMWGLFFIILYSLVSAGNSFKNSIVVSGFVCTVMSLILQLVGLSTWLYTSAFLLICILGIVFPKLFDVFGKSV